MEQNSHHAATLADALQVSDPELTALLAEMAGDGPEGRHAR